MRHCLWQRVDLLDGNDAVLCHPAIYVNTERTEFVAEMNKPASAEETRAARNIRVNANMLSDNNVGNSISNVRNNAHILMTQNNRRRRARCSLYNVNVRAADSARLNLHKHFALIQSP